MCKTKTMQRPFMGALSATMLLGLMAVCKPEVAMAQCNPGIGDSIGVSGPYGNNYVHIGQNATINSVSVFNFTGASICTATNVKTWVVYPDNSFQAVLTFLSNSCRGVVRHSCAEADSHTESPSAAPNVRKAARREGAFNSPRRTRPIESADR